MGRRGGGGIPLCVPVRYDSPDSQWRRAATATSRHASVHGGRSRRHRAAQSAPRIEGPVNDPHVDGELAPGFWRPPLVE